MKGGIRLRRLTTRSATHHHPPAPWAKTQVEMGYVSPDNVFMGLSELERQIGILESLVAQERPQQREQWRRCVAGVAGVCGWRARGGKGWFECVYVCEWLRVICHGIV